MAKRIVLLMSDTGGGHRASAYALVEALQRLNGDAVRCAVVDLLTRYGAWPLSHAASYYEPLVDRHLWLWRAGWWVLQQKTLWRGVAQAAQAGQQAGLRRFTADYPADLYVSVHPLLNHVPRRALRQRYPAARFATVVTDLASAAHMWYDPGVDLLSASCGAVQRAALAAGVPAGRVQLLGLPIRRDFSRPLPDPVRARAALGLEQRPTVLLLGGGAGIGRLEAIAAALAPVLAARRAQIAVICGRNHALRSRLAARRWPLPVYVAGYVDNMSLWMAASDLAVTKAGPGVIAEAMACGLPLVLSSFVPGQETGNVSFVVDNGVGVYCSDARQIAAIAAAWLDPTSPHLPAMRARAQAVAQPQAAAAIAQALARLL